MLFFVRFFAEFKDTFFTPFYLLNVSSCDVDVVPALSCFVFVVLSPTCRRCLFRAIPTGCSIPNRRFELSISLCCCRDLQSLAESSLLIAFCRVIVFFSVVRP